MPKAINNRAGFTIMEVIISSLLLTIIVAGSFGVFVASEGKIRYIGRKLQAANFVRKKFEDLKDAVRQDEWDESSYDLGLKGWTDWENLSGEFYSKWGGQRRYKVEAVTEFGGEDTTYRKVTVQVQWNEP